MNLKPMQEKPKEKPTDEAAPILPPPPLPPKEYIETQKPTDEFILLKAKIKDLQLENLKLAYKIKDYEHYIEMDDIERRIKELEQTT